MNPTISKTWVNDMSHCSTDKEFVELARKLTYETEQRLVKIIDKKDSEIEQLRNSLKSVTLYLEKLEKRLGEAVGNPD